MSRLGRLWSKAEGSNRANSDSSNQELIHGALLASWCKGVRTFRAGRDPQPADFRTDGSSSVLASVSPSLYTRLNMIAAARSHLARSSIDQMVLAFGSLSTSA